MRNEAGHLSVKTQEKEDRGYDLNGNYVKNKRSN